MRRKFDTDNPAIIRTLSIFAACFSLLPLTLSSAELLKVDETEARPGEWGFRPTANEECATTPPPFSWRPQNEAVTYELQVSRDRSFEPVAYRQTNIVFNVHCPSETFAPGKWFWRFRYADGSGQFSEWSRRSAFTIPSDAQKFPLPAKEELLARVPKEHPRLFIRPEDLPRLRALAKGDLQSVYRTLVAQSEALLHSPPPTDEPPKYPPEVERLDERWREIWWGNRVYTINLLNGAATLAFTRLLDGNPAYAELARDLLMAAAEWDPLGSTGYRYNDEAGMPYAYYFSRTYTFLHDFLSEAEREKCRAVMTIRGDEMNRHLNPRHLWTPYSSHSNRAWHFLGEVGLAFLGEIEDADEWVWFALNVFANVYPVWSDTDGGWHEGVSYWRSYIGRFTWWADIMQAATGINAYQKPYFSHAGDWPMYLQPPGTQAGGFGDLAFDKDASGNAELMRILALQARNPHWQWYYESLNRPVKPSGYVDFIRGAFPSVTAEAPVDLPTSKLFRGIGQAVLNTDLLDGHRNISLIFKASPFGTQSHGHEAQNAFQLYVGGRPVLIRTGRRDIHGSDHHRNWMWETKSDNSILANDQGQLKHSPAARAEITGFHTSRSLDFVEGDADEAYPGRLTEFRRRILFAKPHLVVIWDDLAAPDPATYQWLLHSPTEMIVPDQHQIEIRTGSAGCHVNILSPENLKLDQTDKFDPPPRSRVRLRQFHLQASTLRPNRQMRFITVLRPSMTGSGSDGNKFSERLEPVSGGTLLRASLPDGELRMLLRSPDAAFVRSENLETDGEWLAVRYNATGSEAERLSASETRLSLAADNQ